MLKPIKFLVSFMVVFLFLSGCDETSDYDPAAAEEKVDLAINALESELFTIVNMEDVSHPSDVNFNTSNALFKEALELDPENTKANFGAGLTEILIFGQDADVQAVFDAWEAFLDSGSAFVADTALGSPSMSWGFLLPGALRQSPFQTLNEKEVAYSYLNLYKLAVSDPPTIGDIQDVIESNFLPRLDYALERLDVVDDDPNFTFAITPKMQGDAQEDSLEFDLTELYVLEAGINLIRSFCSVAVAYTVGPNAYDSTAIIDFLSQGSGFLSLRTNGAAQLGKAKETLLNASYNMDDAVAFLKAETDDQSDDLIAIRTGELEEADLDSVTKYTAEFRDYLENGITLTEDWNDDGQDTELTFNFSVLFDNPVTDFKSLLPDYTVTVGRDTSYDYTWHDTSLTISLPIVTTLTSPVSELYFNAYYSFSRDEGEYYNVDTNLETNLGADGTVIKSAFSQVVDLMKASVYEDYMSDMMLDYWSININWSGTLGPGNADQDFYIGISYEAMIPEWSYYTGILAFDAEAYADWTFPNPSINGFLQDITSDADLKATFGITEADFLEVKDEPLVIPFEFFSGGIHKRMPSPLVRTRLIPWAAMD